jgi:hypothetical protein
MPRLETPGKLYFSAPVTEDFTSFEQDAKKNIAAYRLKRNAILNLGKMETQNPKGFLKNEPI